MTGVERANQYIDGVLKGKVSVCRWIKLACQRSIDLHKRTDLYYDDAEANRVIAFIEKLPHVKGKWGAQRKRLKLEPWQAWVVSEIFGWKQKETGLRLFRKAFLLIPRKNGKSILAAAIMLYMLIADGEFAPECLCGASNAAQAKEIFDVARRMLQQTPELLEATGIEVNAASIIYPAKNGKAVSIISRPKDGGNVSFGCLDEGHQCRDLALYDSMLTGTAARQQPMVMSVSTAGFGTENPARQQELEARKILEGTVTDDTQFAAIWTIDDGDDWKSEEALLKANPNVGVSVELAYLRSEQKVAISNPTKYASFCTKHENLTVAAKNGFYSLEKWQKCKDESLKLEDFEGEDCWIGIDLASRIDLTAVAVMFRKSVDGDVHYYTFCDCFAPQSAVDNNVVYQQWAARGLLRVNEGNTMDYGAVEALIHAHAARFKLQSVVFDPNRAEHMVQLLQPALSSDVELVEVPQLAIQMNGPMCLLQELILNQHIHHDGDPLLTYGVSNVIPAFSRRGDLVQPAKEKPEYKIDPAVATMLALSRASAAPVIAPEVGFLII